MFHNLFIDIAANVVFCLFWNGERAHNAYWQLMGENPITEIPFCYIDGPFPNHYMAAADFFKRGVEIPGWASLYGKASPADLQEAWAKSFGVNFKKAFNAVGINGTPTDGVVYASYLKE